MRGNLKSSMRLQYKNKIAALSNYEDNGDINRAWDTTTENIKILAECQS
jgi:hypothetical protein